MTDEYPEDETLDAAPEHQNVVTEDAVILTYLFANPSLFSKAAPILKPEYFRSPLSEAVKFVLEQYNKDHKVPNRLLISAKSGFLPELVTDQDDPQVVRLISESVESFCRMKAADSFLLKAVEQIGKDRSNATMSGLREEMGRIANISMARDLGTEFHEDVVRMMDTVKDSVGISTGSDYFDMVLSGGVTRPSFSIYSAATGDGKSIFLANRAVDHIRKHPNEDAVYYTLENSEALTYQRLAAIMAELDIKTVYEEKDKLGNYVARMQGREGRLFIKRLPFRGTTMADIRAHYYDLKAHRSANIRWLGIDYMDLMSPTVDVKVDNIHVRDEQVTAEIYDFIHHENLIGWTAAQQTKGADEEAEAKKGKVSGGVKKVFACDNLFIGKRTDEDAIRQIIWMYCKKGRSSAGINAAIPIKWNNRTQRMTDWNDEEGKAEFRRVNPRLFGYHHKTKFEADPIVQETGAVLPEAPTPENLNARARQITDNLINRLRGPHRAQ